MSLIFPTSPSNGDEYQGYVYDSTDNVWNRLPNNPEFVRFSETAPSNPQEGTLWFNTTVGKMFVYYNDGTSSQWVSAIGGIAGQSGTEGQMLIHDGTEWVAYDGGSRNLLYNGAMQVAQRGTSSTGITTSGYYTADRWNVTMFSLGTWTQTVEADGPANSGLTKSLKMTCTTANSSPGSTSNLSIRQRLEGQDLQALKKGAAGAESVTLSFWVKSNVTGNHIVELYDNDNTRQISTVYSISSSGTWEKKTVTFAGDTTGVFDNDSNLSLYLAFWLGGGSDFTSGALNTSWATAVQANRAVGQVNVAASTSNYWQVTGVQLEAGTVATAFEHKAYGVELAECQRYYYRQSADDVFSYYFHGSSASATGALGIFQHGTMRAAPSSVEVSNVTVSDIVAANFTVSSVVINRGDRHRTVLLANTSGLTNYRPYVLIANNTTNSFVAVSAEL